MNSWRVGDEIVIATTGGRNTLKQSERKTIVAITPDGHNITLNETLTYRHIYHLSSWNGEELEIAAEVGNLNRNIKFHGNINAEWTHVLPECDEDYNPDGSAIQSCYQNKWGDEIGSDEFGAQFLMHYITRGRISNIEVTHAGQAFQLGCHGSAQKFHKILNVKIIMSRFRISMKNNTFSDTDLFSHTKNPIFFSTLENHKYI